MKILVAILLLVVGAFRSATASDVLFLPEKVIAFDEMSPINAKFIDDELKLGYTVKYVTCSVSTSVTNISGTQALSNAKIIVFVLAPPSNPDQINNIIDLEESRKAKEKQVYEEKMRKLREQYQKVKKQ